MSRLARPAEPVVLPNYQAQLRAAEEIFPALIARMRNMAAELEGHGWQCEIIDGAWVFSMPQEVSDGDGAAGAV